MEAIETTRRIGLNVLTNSAESSFKKCPRDFELRYRIGLRPENDGNALRIGSAFHAGLECLKKGETLETAIGMVRQMYFDAPLPPWQTLEEFQTEEEIVVAMVSGWAWRWSGDTIIKYLAVELPFSLPIINPATGRASRTFVNQGKIDGIADLPNGQIALVEHKTCGSDISPTADYWRKLTMDAQVSRYVLAARELGYPVTTIAYDVTRKPEISPKLIPMLDDLGRKIVLDGLGNRVFKKNGEPRESASAADGFVLQQSRETPAAFGARLLDDMKQRPDFYFARMEVPRTSSDLERFQKEQWMIAKQIMQADSMGLFYRNTNSCTSPYRCSFFDVCANGIDPEHEIPSGFKVVDVLHPELATDPIGAENQ